MATTPPTSSDGPASDGIAPEKPKTPTAARVAVLVMWILTALLVLGSTLTVVVRQALPLVDLILALLLGLSAWGLARRHAWARWVGLGAASMLFALLLLAMLAAGSANLISLLMLLLAMTAATGLASRSTGEWIPRLRGGS